MGERISTSADGLRPQSFAPAIVAVALTGGISTHGTVGPRLRRPGPGFAIGVLDDKCTREEEAIWLAIAGPAPCHGAW